VRTVTRPVLHTEPIPLQMPAAAELLDANSTATVTVLESQSGTVGSYIRDLSVLKDLTAVTVWEEFQPGIGVAAGEQKQCAIATANREVLVDEDIHVTTNGVPGIFVAARPPRRKLFEMQLVSPRGGLPKRKPFVWIQRDLSEE